MHQWIKAILFNCPGGGGHYPPLAMPPLFCKKPFHQAGHAYAYAGITRQCTASLLQYTHSSPHLDKPGSFAQTFPSERDSGECKDGIKCGHKFQVVAEDVVLTWDEEKQQRSLEELARTASSGIKEEPD